MHLPYRQGDDALCSNLVLLVTYISVCLPTYLLLYSFRVTLQEKCICAYVCGVQSFTIDELAKLSNALLTTLLKVCNAINTAHRCSSPLLLVPVAVTFDFGDFAKGSSVALGNR